MATFIHFLAIISLSLSVALAYDPSPLQDFCVGIPNGNVMVNGLVCKDPNTVTANDFFLSGLQIPASTANPLGFNATPADVTVFPGLNTLGVSLLRLDFAPGGLAPPHVHPRASEILVVIEGTLEVGFVTSNTANGNTLFTKVLNPGDVFVFPIGLIHFQRNVGKTNAVSISALSSQNPGVYFIPMAVFGSNPPIPVGVLSKAFQLDAGVVKYLQKVF